MNTKPRLPGPKKFAGSKKPTTKSLIKNARQLRREMTNAEQTLWKCLRGRRLRFKFRRQVPYGRYILDFYCPETALVLELDGGQHYTNEGIEKDMARDKYLQKRGLKVLRFSDRDVLSNLNGVMQRIYEEFENLKNIEKTPP